MGMMAIECLQVEPTTRCNFTCGFCCGRTMAQGDLELDAFTELIDALPSLRHIELQGEGEPLLHPRFFEMVRYARARGIRVSFITNGSHFTAENIEAILEAPPEVIFVSIESPEEQAFKEIRGGLLSKVKKRVAALMAAKRERGLERPRVGFAISILKRTLDTLPGIVALYEELGLDGGVSMQPLQRMEAYASVYTPEVEAQLLGPDDMKRLRKSPARGPLLSLQELGNQNGGFYQELWGRWKPDQGCPWLAKGLYASRTGDLTPCCSIKDAHRFGSHLDGANGVEAMSRISAELSAELLGGTVPAACQGCPIAETVVTAVGGVVDSSPARRAEDKLVQIKRPT